jgi:O-antigen/teichoic acid export membrane protein
MSEHGPRPTPEVARRRGFKLRGRTVRQHIARGVVINAAFTIGFSALSLVRGFVVAAFLSREDYGVWGILAVSLFTLLSLKNIGIGDKYIQQDEEDQEAAFQKAFTLELMLTLGFVALLVALLPVIALVYGQEQVIGPGLVLIAAFPAGVLQMPIWSYARSMQFLRQRLLQGVDPLVGFVVAVALAIAGAGYWALIVGVVAGAWSAALASVLWSPFKLALRFDRDALRTYASFSWPLFVAGLAGIVIAQGSILASEEILGLAAAGGVTLAATITQFTQRVDSIVTGTLYPALCAVNDRLDLLNESFVKSNRLALMWAMPFGLGLALFAPDLVNFVLGSEWDSTVVLLQIFGVVAAIGHVGFNWSAYFLARGETKPLAVVGVASAVTFVIALVPLTQAEGLTGLGIAIALQAVADWCLRIYYLTRLFEGFGVVRHAMRAVLPSIPPTLLVLLLRLVEPDERTAGIAAAELSSYVVLTVATTFILEGPLIREARSYLRPRDTASAPA